MGKDEVLSDGTLLSEQGRKKVQGVFAIADFRIIRKAKNYNVELKAIPQLNYAVFDVDGIEVTAKKRIIKTRDGRDRSYLEVKCDCDHCGAIGIARMIDCARKKAVDWYLIRHNGRIHEGMISRRFLPTSIKKPLELPDL